MTAGAAAAALLVALAGCTSSDDGDEPSSSEPTSEATSDDATEEAAGDDSSADLSSYYTQDVTWTPQPDGSETAKVTVPIDYEDPTAGDMELMLKVVRANPESDRYLLINPGGPGGSGVDFVNDLSFFASVQAPDVSSTYNLLGFDPRGVGQSDPLTCLDTEALDDVIAASAPADDDGEEEAAAGVETLAEGCASTNGDEASHVSTVEAAQDMEVIRQALGADELDYLGFSYGTFLGTTYAALFPEHVGRMVLDGAIDPSQDPVESSLTQASGFQTAFEAWAADCVEGGCPVGDSVEQISSTVAGLLEEADGEPLPTRDEDRPLTGSLAFLGIGEPLYGKDAWPDLTAAIAAAIDGDGSKLLASADNYADRTKKGYRSNQYVAQQVVNALDCQIAGRGATDVSEDEFVERSPVFGRNFYYGTVAQSECDDLTLTSDLEAPDYSAPGAAPILVVGTTRDPATPLVNSENLADLLDSGVLLTRDGDGHTAFLLAGNPCIDRTVSAYLADGKLPRDGKQCADTQG